jgi:hypothetical protein
MYARTIKSNKPPPSNQNSKKPKQHEYINKNSKKIREQKIREQWIKIRKTKKKHVVRVEIGRKGKQRLKAEADCYQHLHLR